MPWQILLILLLILANGFFACAEISLIAARKSNIKELAEKGNRAARAAALLQGDPERLLATVQVGITIVGSAAAAVGGVAAVESLKPYLAGLDNPVLAGFSEAIAMIIAVVLISYLNVTFGELVPKSLAIRYPERLALWVAIPMEFFARSSSWLTRILTATSRWILKPLGPGPAGPFVTEEEIRLLLKEGREKGVFDPTEQELIHSVFEFHDISVREVMVHRLNIHALQSDTPVQEVLKFVAENKFSRYPVYKTNINDICGILVFKDLLATLAEKVTKNDAEGGLPPSEPTPRPQALAQDPGSPKTASLGLSKPDARRNPEGGAAEVKLVDLLHPVFFVPETMKVSHLLKELQRRRMQMAIVVNEYGSVEGLVTMEDLIEEIVGEIRDEYDIEERPVERLKDGSLAVDASLAIRDLASDWGLVLPESPEYETLGGFVLSQLQAVPRGGDIIYYGDFKFTVVDMDGRRIAKVKAERIPAAAPARK